MKALPFRIPKPADVALYFQIDTGKYYAQLHEHEEIQVSYIRKGKGTLIAGDGVHHYMAGQVLILGSRLPHLFKEEGTQPEMHSIFFSPNTLGGHFMELEEARALRQFRDRSETGLWVAGTPEIDELFSAFPEASPAQRLPLFLALVDILLGLATAPLSAYHYGKPIRETDGQKLHTIFEYTLAHFNQPMTLRAVADRAAMTPNAFCKYFKKHTRKTYFQYITELRITKACQLLQEHRDMPITMIAELCGFQTVSHFNRKFKGLKGVSPTGFRKGEY